MRAIVVAAVVLVSPALAQQQRKTPSPTPASHPPSAVVVRPPPAHGPPPTARPSGEVRGVETRGPEPRGVDSRGNEPHGVQTRGPDPRAVEPRPVEPRYDTHGASSERPHLDERGRWIGHESGPQDRRYQMVHPWVGGRFALPIGPENRYRMEGWEPERHRFWFGGYYFGVAAWDWDYLSDWDWTNDEIVIYDDPDHEGWYLAYNTRLGTYAHVQYDARPE